MKDDDSNTSELEEFDESLNENLEGILENSNLINNVEENQIEKNIEENIEDTVILTDEKEYTNEEVEEVNEEKASKDEVLEEEKENIKLDSEKSKNTNNKEDVDIDEDLNMDENDLDVNDSNLLNEINEITGENIDSKELEDSLLEELDKYEEFGQEDYEIKKDNTEESVESEYEKVDVDDLKETDENEIKVENENKYDNEPEINVQDTKELETESEINLEDSIEQENDIKTQNEEKDENIENETSENNSNKDEMPELKYDDVKEENEKVERTKEDIKNEIIKSNDDSFLGSEVKKLLSEGFDEESDDENIEIEENVSEKEDVTNNEIKVENNEIKPKLKDNNKNLQFNGTFDSIESENKKAENQANELLDLAFKQKSNEDYQGAIESFTQALNVVAEDESNEVVFWIVLDICILYKKLGQGELAKEILNGYYSEYKGLMSEEIREKIENNL
jgi:hypothetical protein